MNNMKMFVLFAIVLALTSLTAHASRADFNSCVKKCMQAIEDKEKGKEICPLICEPHLES